MNKNHAGHQVVNATKVPQALTSHSDPAEVRLDANVHVNMLDPICTSFK